MGRTSPECLSTAGGVFVAAGFIAALTGGLYGLQSFRPGFVVLSVLLVMGFSVTGYLLHSKRDAAFGAASGLAALLVLATIGVFQAGAFTLFGSFFTYLVLFPATGYLLALGVANLVAYGLARRHSRVLWPPRSVDAVGSLLQAAALAPVLGVFMLANLGGPAAAPGFEQGVLFTLGITAGVATAAGGILASIKRHPRFAVGGGAGGFLASVILLFEFSARGPAGLLGQLVSLGGLLLAAFPIARAVIAWVELESAKKEARARTGARTDGEPAAAAKDAPGPRAR